MRYFLLEQDKGYTDIPRPLNWFDVLAPGKAMESLKNMPEREIFRIESGKETFFLDLFTDPVVLASVKAKECIEMYEPNMTFKEVVLLDRKQGISKQYFVPFFTELDCLSKETEFTNWNYDLKKAVLDGEKLRDKVIFTVKGPQKLNIVIRLDAVESLLRRSVKGLMLKELEVK